MRRAWLQRAIDTSAREDAAVFFMFMLCGLYGFIVVCYGFLIGGKDWKGFGSAIFLILVVLSLFISALPAFVVKSDVGIVSNYTYNLVRLANVAEFRYRNESGGTRSFKVEKGGDVRWFGRVARAFAFEVPKGCGYIVGRYSGVLLTVALPVVVLVRRCLAPESNSNDRDIGQGFAFLVTSVFLAAFFELMILFALYVKAESISVGGFNFQQSVLPVLVAILSFSWSVMYVSMIFNALYRWWVVVVVAASPPLWWFVRFLLVLFMKPFGEVVHNDVSGIKKKFHQLCACLEDRSGLRGVMMVSVDQCLLECRSSVNSCVDRNVQIAAELNAVFDQVIPKICCKSYSRRWGGWGDRIEESKELSVRGGEGDLASGAGDWLWRRQVGGVRTYFSREDCALSLTTTVRPQSSMMKVRPHSKSPFSRCAEVQARPPGPSALRESSRCAPSVPGVSRAGER